MLIHNNDQEATTRYAAEIMSRLRPDIYSVERAIADLSRWISDLSPYQPGHSIGTAGFILTKITEDANVNGYELSLKLADWLWFNEDDGAINFGGSIWKADWVKTPIEETV